MAKNDVQSVSYLLCTQVIKPQILKRRKAEADRTEVLLLTSLPTPAHTLRQVSFSKPDVAVYLSYERRPQNLLVACGNKLKAWSGSAAFYLTEGTTLMMIMSHLHATADKGSKACKGEMKYISIVMAEWSTLSGNTPIKLVTSVREPVWLSGKALGW